MFRAAGPGRRTGPVAPRPVTHSAQKRMRNVLTIPSPDVRSEPTGLLRAGARPLLLALLLATAGGITGVAAPVQAATSDPAKAEELIRQANELRRQGHDERAMPLLRKAYEIARSARTAGQLGLAEMALGYWLSAETHLNEALAETRNPWVGKNRAALDSALRETQTHLGDVRVEGKPDGAEITVNGSVVGTLPLGNSVRVNEGRVTVEAHAPGHKPRTMSVTVAARATERVQIALEPEDAAPPPQASARVVPPSSIASQSTSGEAAGERPGPSEGAPRHTRRSDSQSGNAQDELPTWQRALPWALLGGAAIAGGIGVWQQLSSQNAQADFDDIPACGAGLPMRGTDARCQGLYDDFHDRKTRAFIGYGVAGLLGAGAVTLFIVNAVSTPAAGGDGATASTGGQPVVAFTGNGAFLTYAGRF